MLHRLQMIAIASEIVLGEFGTGKTDFSLALYEQMSGEFNRAIADNTFYFLAMIQEAKLVFYPLLECVVDVFCLLYNYPYSFFLRPVV
jgi:hypothetical protein